jgi:putative nucleotidyltransferase with HDIG domain
MKGCPPGLHLNNRNPRQGIKGFIKIFEKEANHLDNKKYEALNCTVKESGRLKLSNRAIGETADNSPSSNGKKVFAPIRTKRMPENLNLKNSAAELMLDSLFNNSSTMLNHGQTVSELCEAVAKEMRLSPADIDEIKIAGLLHDIGKTEIDESLLNKTGELKADEWAKIKQHSEMGYQKLITLKGFSKIAGYILAHHEKWDGSGYPHGLKGEQIPLHARIIAVADAYDAMTSDRPYKKAVSGNVAIAELRANAGTQFDPEVVESFLNVFKVQMLFA